jgi:glycosyltransferase involved in cell wall biosynthesis
VSSRLFVQATNVHQGGGKTLLSALLGACTGVKQIVALLDSRMILPVNIPANLTVKSVTPTVWQRLRVEWWLNRDVTSDDIVLCFGNLPPLFKLDGHVVVFVQNRYLVDDIQLGAFSLKVRLRLIIERVWFLTRTPNVDEFVVQTPTMKALLEARTKRKIPILVLPFIDSSNGYTRGAPSSEKRNGEAFDFIYVASGEPHKNHRQLIEAWCLLAEKGVFPSLKLTLDRADFAELCAWIDRKTERYQLNVSNLGSISSEEITMLYSSVDALIYPSKFESFGLPLIEARQASLPVLASELDYVRDVLDPEQAFDPESAVSIVRAVKRFMGIEESALPLLDAGAFMKQILTRSE